MEQRGDAGGVHGRWHCSAGGKAVLSSRFSVLSLKPGEQKISEIPGLQRSEVRLQRSEGRLQRAGCRGEHPLPTEVTGDTGEFSTYCGQGAQYRGAQYRRASCLWQSSLGQSSANIFESWAGFSAVFWHCGCGLAFLMIRLSSGISDDQSSNGQISYDRAE